MITGEMNYEIAISFNTEAPFESVRDLGKRITEAFEVISIQNFNSPATMAEVCQIEISDPLKSYEPIQDPLTSSITEGVKVWDFDDQTCQLDLYQQSKARIDRGKVEKLLEELPGEEASIESKPMTFEEMSEIDAIDHASKIRSFARFIKQVEPVNLIDQNPITALQLKDEAMNALDTLSAAFLKGDNLQVFHELPEEFIRAFEEVGAIAAKVANS